MSMRIRQNVMSLMAQRNLSTSQSDLERSFQRLSSGLRINHAWDDTAGFKISERFRAQIASMEEAERNTEYAINLLQTADGAMSVIDDKLIQMRTLAIEASNGVLTSQDRVILDNEFAGLRSEIDRIARTVNYNGKYLLDGSWTQESANGIKFHIGTMNTTNLDYYYIQMDNATINALGLDSLNLLSTASAQNALGDIDSAIESKDQIRTRLGAYVDRLQSSVSDQMTARQNAVASESEIRDADIAREMSDFVRSQIMMQAGTSMLTQANMAPQIVAGLIG